MPVYKNSSIASKLDAGVVAGSVHVVSLGLTLLEERMFVCAFNRERWTVYVCSSLSGCMAGIRTRMVGEERTLAKDIDFDLIGEIFFDKELIFNFMEVFLDAFF